jgi:molybdopterin-guanine dinucleotide biosynthesis protein A
MGRDKAALPFGTESCLERVVRLARDVAHDVTLVGRSAAPAPTNVHEVIDRGDGPLVALTAGAGLGGNDLTLVLACDMPLVRPALLRYLVERIADHEACVPRVDGVAVPTCAVYARRVAPVAQAVVAAGERSLRALLDRLSVRWVDDAELREVDPDLRSFIDCDTPQDYARALRIAGLDR